MRERSRAALGRSPRNRSVPRPPALSTRGRRVLFGAGAALCAVLFTVSGTPTTPRDAFGALAAVLPPSAAPAVPVPEGADRPTLQVLSSRPDTVMGGTALVRLGLPTGTDPDRARLTVDGRDVTDALRAVYVDGVGPALEGVLTGLPEGGSTLVASLSGRRARTRLAVTNHPAQGPVFSGPQERPFVCDTDSFTLHGGGTLGPALDEDCSAPTVVRHMYRTTGGAWAAMPDPGRVPDDAARTTTSTGAEVPYTVRVETGTANRAIYETAVLFTPGADGPDPWHAPEGWNRRLVYKFGGGCKGGWYVQGSRTAGVLDHGMLSRGYAVASATLNVFGFNCNDLLAAETTAAVRERFVLAHGAPDLTLGWGSSGGAYQAHQIADNYPGLLDGVVVSQSFPDVLTSLVPAAVDALLLDAYARKHPQALSRDQQLAVSGFPSWRSIERMAREAVRIDPEGTCRDRVPDDLLYHPEDNPRGARCELFAHTVNVYGADPDTGLPRRPLDNVGVQYGLGALLEGDIDVDEFLHLNEHIGGVDADGRVTAARTVADPAATAAAYRTGRLLNGGGGLARIPVVDHRTYLDDSPKGDVHMRYHSFATRERLRAANGTADNHVMLVEARGSGGLSASAPVAGRALVELDAWATGILELGREHPWVPVADRVRAARPEWLTDSCWVGEAPRRRVVGEQLPLGAGSGDTCAQVYPVHSSPRMVAGAPLASDVIRCRLVPFDAKAHPAEFTGEQARRAARVFAEGVCDWSAPGEGQQDLAGTWLRF
ncbi:DUF6351 family protein [Nocardiopsis sp. FIRDI 009]|uniref:DUF6351 family protein n=1 Tax=Nocardiopsis sp. FIRDI 009 TaxID=714197 RepID=UPI001E3C6C63|nr:DUF6351 family protein [Nocardiopsis sp. FIRDI 009]